MSKLSFASSSLQVPEYVVEQFEIEEVTEDQEDEELQAVIASLSTSCNISTSSTSNTSAPSQQLDIANSPLSFCPHINQELVESFTKPVVSIIVSRSSTSPSSSTYHPLTSRHVERIFSYWRRKMDRSSSFKPVTIQMHAFLHQFPVEEIERILYKQTSSSFSKWFVTYLTTCDNKRDLRKKVYELLYFVVLLYLLIYE
jgi:hypothetical protein